jgi:exopolyphosphatase/guanosine-5'-triphosphate,3'-diphosphate pyrophosphatase
MRVAVVDIGSNSIKLLVAEQAKDGRLAEVASDSLEVRISRGIGSKAPRLEDEAMDKGVAAVAQLVFEARRLGAEPIAAAATSAVRDASNGAEFRRRVRSAAGLEVRVVSGTEEANLIGRGITTDPALEDLRDFRLFDLGGGSLECLSFRDRQIERAASLPLGCVRLTEKLLPDATLAFGDQARQAVCSHVREALLKSPIAWPVPPGVAVVGTGGTLTTVRSILAAEGKVAFERTDPGISVPQLQAILERVGPMDLASRKTVRGLPAARADVFPAALATLLALAELGAFGAFRHSLRNLRWGLAAELLD